MTSPEVIFTICRRTTASPYYIFKSLITECACGFLPGRSRPHSGQTQKSNATSGFRPDRKRTVAHKCHAKIVIFFHFSDFFSDFLTDFFSGLKLHIVGTGDC